MLKRFIPVFFIYILMMQFVMIQIYKIVIRDDYVEVARQQGTYSLKVASTRGTIYDCNMKPISGGYDQYYASIAPSVVDVQNLYSQISGEEVEKIKGNLKKTYPFALQISEKNISGNGITLLKSYSRYNGDYLASHTIGYLDGSGEKGLTGIEKAYDSLLSEAEGELKIKYQVDARGGVLAGFKPEVTDTTAKSKAGVVLTLDKDIQKAAENAADEYLKAGAVIVMEVPSGDIKALVSRPDFSPVDVAAVLDSADAPLINRTLSAFDVGSVFKLVTAAAALECGISEETLYTCTGSLEIGNNVFTCNNGVTHGELNMEGALCCSCNLYFIQLAQEIGAERLLSTAQALGFGKAIELAPEYKSYSGTLPDAEALTRPAELANLSFGQGQLMATPLHIASLVGTIASKGTCITPRLVEKTVDKYGNTIEVRRTASSKMVINDSTARSLSKFMYKTALEGTAIPGMPEFTTAAAKTGTAETGIKKEGKKVLQAWYAGFFPYEKPRYVCVVLAENGQSGGKSAGPVFKKIADEIV